MQEKKSQESSQYIAEIQRVFKSKAVHLDSPAKIKCSNLIFYHFMEEVWEVQLNLRWNALRLQIYHAVILRHFLHFYVFFFFFWQLAIYSTLFFLYRFVHML